MIVAPRSRRAAILAHTHATDTTIVHTKLERFVLGVLVVGYVVAHLAPVSVAWPVVAIMSAVAVAGAIVGSASAVGASVLLVPAATLTRLGVPWPAPLAIGGAMYLAFDRVFESQAGVSWSRLGRLDRRLAIAVLGISIVASGSLILWTHFTGTSLAGFRHQFPDGIRSLERIR